MALTLADILVLRDAGAVQVEDGPLKVTFSGTAAKLPKIATGAPEVSKPKARPRVQRRPENLADVALELAGRPHEEV